MIFSAILAVLVADSFYPGHFAILSEYCESGKVHVRDNSFMSFVREPELHFLALSFFSVFFFSELSLIDPYTITLHPSSL